MRGHGCFYSTQNNPTQPQRHILQSSILNVISFAYKDPLISSPPPPKTYTYPNPYTSPSHDISLIPPK